MAYPWRRTAERRRLRDAPYRSRPRMSPPNPAFVQKIAFDLTASILVKRCELNEEDRPL
jgi:hypothetical protein